VRNLWIAFTAVIVLSFAVLGWTGGYWYARSPEFLQTGTIETFRWLRVVGDTIFATFTPL
jgi:nitric oxide reductase large subunit